MASNRKNVAETTQDIEASAQARAIAAQAASDADKARAEKEAAEQLLADAAKAAADADRAAREASDAINPKPADPTPAPKPVAWAPVESLDAGAVRARLAKWGRAMLTSATRFAYLNGEQLEFEPGEILALIGALESGKGIAAAPRHLPVCEQVWAVMEAAGMPKVCPATCPVGGATPARAPRATTGTPRAAGASTGGTKSGNREFHYGDIHETGISAARAAELAAQHIPSAARCKDYVAKKAEGQELNANKFLQGDMDRDNVPAGTFGPDVVKRSDADSRNSDVVVIKAAA